MGMETNLLLPLIGILVMTVPAAGKSTASPGTKDVTSGASCQYNSNCTNSSDYCRATTEFGVQWERTAVNQEIFKNCSLVDSAWQGTFSRECQRRSVETFWSNKTSCTCENSSTINYFKGRVAEANETNIVNISRELASSVGNFIRMETFFKIFNDLFDVGVKRFTPVTEKNADLALMFVWNIIGTVDPGFVKEKTFCYSAPVVRCDAQKVDEGTALVARALNFFNKEFQNTTAFNASLPQITIWDCHFLEEFKSVDVWIENVPLLSVEYPQEIYDVTISVMNKTGREHTNFTDKQKTVILILEAKGCKGATFDKSGNLIIKNPVVTNDVLRHREIQDKMENVLLCISVGAIIVYFIVLSVLRSHSTGHKYRVKISERIFVHINLLLSLGLAELVSVLDNRAFSTRNEHPVVCSSVTAIKHFLQTSVFTWMLVEGMHLYIKLVKVFSVKKHYLAFVLVGWGIPTVIVGIVASIRPSTYDMGETLVKDVTCGATNFTGVVRRTSCWINGSLWIFKGPVLLFLVINAILFVILLRVIFGKLSQKYGQDKVTLTKRGMRSIMALLPLLGVTYLVGFFIEFHTAVAYVFILLNSTQGILFSVFHCFFDDQIREAFQKRNSKHNSAPRITERFVPSAAQCQSAEVKPPGVTSLISHKQKGKQQQEGWV